MMDWCGLRVHDVHIVRREDCIYDHAVEAWTPAGELTLRGFHAPLDHTHTTKGLLNQALDSIGYLHT